MENRGKSGRTGRDGKGKTNQKKQGRDIDTSTKLTDKKNAYHFCLMSLFLPLQNVSVVITDFRSKQAGKRYLSKGGQKMYEV